MGILVMDQLLKDIEASDRRGEGKKKKKKKKQICSGIWALFQVPLIYSQVANHPITSSQGSCLTGPLCAVQEHLDRTEEKSCVLECRG